MKSLFIDEIEDGSIGLEPSMLRQSPAIWAAGVMALVVSSTPMGPTAHAVPTVPTALEQRTAPELRVPKDFNPSDYVLQGDRLVVATPSSEVVLTLLPSLQEQLRALLNQYEVPAAGVVVMDPATGKILAYVNHRLKAQGPDMVIAASAPAASIFKIVTAAALLDKGVLPSTRVCYGGGFQKLTTSDLQDDPRRDTACATLADAMGQSINTVFAKLALHHLDVASLKQYASAFGFGHRLPFDIPTEPSALDIPDDELEFARTSAGFWHSYLSPLHGALVAATIANGGKMPRAYMVESVRYPCGELKVTRDMKPFRSVLSASTANALADMMQRTVSKGTSFKAFHDPKGNPFLPGMAIAGKTGSLSSLDPYRAYSWWVGFAPAEAPRYVVSALLINSAQWRIKASFVAREALRFATQKEPTVKHELQAYTPG